MAKLNISRIIVVSQVFLIFFFSVNASFSERFPEKCPTFHSHVGHYKEKFECSFHSWKYCSRVTWIDCNSVYIHSIAQTLTPKKHKPRTMRPNGFVGILLKNWPLLANLTLYSVRKTWTVSIIQNRILNKFSTLIHMHKANLGLIVHGLCFLGVNVFCNREFILITFVVK